MRNSGRSDSDLTVREWQHISRDLGVDIQTPFKITLPSGARIVAPVLVLGFGAEKGMVIVTDYDEIEPYIDELVECGYGFSTLTPASSDDYDRESVIELLSDWEWVGNPDARPTWVRDIEND